MKIKLIEGVRESDHIGSSFVLVPQSDGEVEILERMLTGGVEVEAVSFIEDPVNHIVRADPPDTPGGKMALRFATSIPVEGGRVVQRAKKKVTTGG